MLFAVGSHSPLMAQKKLALANECFQAKAYYLASRYYQEVFANKTNKCHPDKIKLAQSLAATQQLEAAGIVFERHMSCQKFNSRDHMVYGKFLMDLKAYEKAIPYFEKAMETEPDLARHYILACQMALPKSVKSEPSASVFVNQTTDTALPKTEVIDQDDEIVKTFPTHKEILNKNSQGQIDQTTAAINGINLFEAMKYTDDITSSSEVQVANTNIEGEGTVVINEMPARTVTVTKEKISPYGVRLGTYKDAIIPDLSVVEQYGRITQKKWKGKTIVFLVDFTSRTAAEAALKVARKEKFHTATLVEKLASGRMKSIR